MIEHYSFGSMTISGKRYSSDLKIINGQVYPDWWRKTGHSVDVDEVTDIIKAKPDYLIIGSGKSGLMKVSNSLRQRLEDIGVEVIVEHTSEALGTFNRMYADGKNIAGGFHLSC
jgi:hypothetical protein